MAEIIYPKLLQNNGEFGNGNIASPFPYSLRDADYDRWENWAKNGMNDVQLATIGVVGATDGEGELIQPGLRILSHIAHMAHAVQGLKNQGYGEPQVTFIYPGHINAHANGVPADRNMQYGALHYQLAVNYFTTMHPELKPPLAKVDCQEGIPYMDEIAAELLGQVSQNTLNILRPMAEKFNNVDGASDGELMQRSLTYLLAHYGVYRQWESPYMSWHGKVMYLVPPTETHFHDLMYDEQDVVGSILPLALPTLDSEGTAIVTYSNIIRTPHYFPHRKEPEIASINGSLPTDNELNKKGMNGRAYQEVVSALQEVRQDLARGPNSPENNTTANMKLLKEKVIKPYVLALQSM